VPRLTGLRRSRPGWVVLEVDGRPWRTAPDDVVVRCGLASGLELERPLLRELRRELKRAEALAAAGRALSHRDLSRRQLAERLHQRGVAEHDAAGALATLADAGLLNDERLARRRALTLAERGWGDAAIEERLDRDCVEAAIVRAALAELPIEYERARALAASIPDRRKRWTLLARRGFSPDTIEEVLAGLDADG
jgi:regulatory protein